MDLITPSHSLRWSSEIPGGFIVGAALASVAVVVVYYLRETRSLPTPVNFLIPSLRAAAVALAIITVGGPVWHRQTIQGTLGRVVLLVDVSGSMTLADTSQFDTSLAEPQPPAGSSVAPSRIQRAMRLIRGTPQRAGWVERLKATHHVEVVKFSPGDQTDIESALARIAVTGDQNSDKQNSDNQETGEPTTSTVQTAVVLMSDGQHNVAAGQASGSPGGQTGRLVDQAVRLRSAGASVHAVGMGTLDPAPGFGIARVDRPDSVPIDATLVGSIVLSQSQSVGDNVSVAIETADGVSLFETQVTLTGAVNQTVPFQWQVRDALDLIAARTKVALDAPATTGVQRDAGVMDLRAVVRNADAVPANDTIPQDNQFAFRVAASAKKSRLMILDGASRWETRYLTNLFDRDPAWQVNQVLFGPGTGRPRLLHGDQDGQFPDSLESISAYDAVILGEIPAEFFDQRDSQLLRQFVQRGGGLILVDGPYGQLSQMAEGRLPNLFPIQYGGDAATVSAGIVPTDVGMNQPALDLLGDVSQSESFWQTLPPPTRVSMVVAKPSAEVWANSHAAGGEVSPWLVTQRFGSGRVVYLATDQTWRWRYKVADQFHSRFWNAVVGAVLSPPYRANDNYLSLGTDKLEYATGERAMIQVRLRDAGGNAAGRSTVDAIITSEEPGRQVATVPLIAQDRSRGTYQGQAPELPDGKYQVRIRASDFDQDALRATTPIWIGRQGLREWNRTHVDQPTLEAITRAGGGQYRHESSADIIFNEIQTLSSGKMVQSDHSLWETFYWFWAMVCLVTAEWILRKRHGLI